MTSRYKNLGKATQIALGFFSMYIAASSSSNILSTTMATDGYDQLGFYSLAVVALSMGIGSVVSTAVMNVIGEKACLVIGGLTVSASLFVLVIPAFRADDLMSDKWFYSTPFIYAILLISEFFTGFGLALAWVAQGKYMSDCASDEAKGFFFGYFWAFYMASQVFGNLIAGFILGSSN